MHFGGVQVSSHAQDRYTNYKICEDDIVRFVEKIEVFYTLRDRSRRTGYYRIFVNDIVMVVYKGCPIPNKKMFILTVITIYPSKNDEEVMLNTTFDCMSVVYQGKKPTDRESIVVERFPNSYKRITSNGVIIGKRK